MLVDRGLLKYGDLVSDLWPEYAAHGKGSTTVAMLMRHEAGLSEFDQPLEVYDLTADAVRGGCVSDVIAAQRPSHAPGAKRMYHSLTRGWIVNEVVRRADPEGRTIGEFLADEIAAPLGLESELCVGLPDELHARY